jgi:hypothetical protein
VNLAIDCSLPATQNDQPVGNGWAVVVTLKNCEGISPNWPFGTTWELKTGSTVVPATTAGVQGAGTSGTMQPSPQWTGLSTSSTYVLTINLPDPLPAAYITGFTNGKNTSGSKSGVAGTKAALGAYFSVYYFTIDPSYVPSGGTPTTQTRVRGNVKATVDSVTFADDGTGTAGSLTWKGTNIDSVLYTGPATTYPKAFNYGAYTSSWNGALQNLTPNTTYTFDFFVNSIDDYSSKISVTFKTGPAKAAVKDSAYWTKFVDTYVIYAWEAANIKTLLSKLDAVATSPYRAFIKVPTSRVTNVVVTSLTPKSCLAEANGVVHAISADTCTISYTVTGPSKAPVTVVKDYKFTRFAKF